VGDDQTPFPYVRYGGGRSEVDPEYEYVDKIVFSGQSSLEMNLLHLLILPDSRTEE